MRVRWVKVAAATYVRSRSVDCLEQLREADPEPPRDFGDHFEGRVPSPPLQCTHIGTVNADGVGEAFLGVVRFFPEAPNRPAEPDLEGCHARYSMICHPIDLPTIK